MINDMEDLIDDAIIRSNAMFLNKPCILMHEKDLEILEKHNKDSVTNFPPIGERPTYRGIPITTSIYIERGVFLVGECKQLSDLTFLDSL